jgi:SAM-dependent methyltransferase
MPAATLQLSPAELRWLFDRLGPSLGLWRAAEIAALRRERIDPPVLDLGCGDGIVTSLVLRRVALGVDPSPEAVRRAAALGLYERLEIAPIEALDLPAQSVGTVISNSVLEHVPNIANVLGAVARLLRPGGRLIYTVPTEAFTGWLALPCAAYGGWRNRHYLHRNLWPVERWAYQLRQAGLAIVSVRPYLRRWIVAAWDALELAQRVRIGRRRLFGICWRRLPRVRAALADRLARLDLSAPEPGGGRIIVAEKARIA